MREHGVPVFTVEREYLRTIALQNLHTLDHRRRRIELSVTKARLKGNVVNLLHVVEQIVLKSLNNVVNRTIAAVKRRFRGVREPQHIGHLDRLHRRRPHKLKDGILDAGADIVLGI